MEKLNNEEQSVFDKFVDPDQQKQQAKYIWSEDFQRVVLGMLLCNRFFLVQSLGMIQSNYFLNEIHELLCKLVLEHFDKYGQQPSKIWLREQITEILKKRHKDGSTAEAMKLLYMGELNTVYDYYTRGGIGDLMPGLDSTEAILDKVTAFARTQAAKMAFWQCQQIIRKDPESDETWAKYIEITKQVSLVGRKIDLGLEYFGTLDERYDRLSKQEEEKDVFSAAFRKIDEGLNFGGLRVGEMGAWMGTPGTGKTHLINTMILMADGTMKKVQDIVVGNLVMGDDSTPRKVLATHRLFDRMYEVKPVKGDSYYVNSKHILSLKNSNRQGHLRNDRPTKRRKNPHFSRHPARVGKTDIFNISVEDWLKESNQFKIKMKGWRVGVEWPAKDIKIDPYFLGLWLGDGTSKLPEITNMDVAIIERIKLEVFYRHLKLKIKQKANMECCSYLLYETIEKSGSLYDDLVVYKLIDNKHIPHDYKVNSRENRLQLLAGLIDTDGHKHKGNGFDISQKSKVLAEDILFLARSLGFAAYMSIGKKKSQNGTEGVYHRISISGNCSEIPVRIGYKKCEPRKQVKNHLFTGINVVNKNLFGEFYGFETDGNHLFLLGDFTVVHNSLCLVKASVKNMFHRGKKVLYISTEMDQDLIATRFDSMITKIGQHQLIPRRLDVKKAINEQMVDFNDQKRLYIKQFPSGTADVNMIRAFHSQLVMYGFKPDLVILDYPGDLKDMPGMDGWESRWKTLRDLRGFGVEEKHCTLIAIQPNRSASKLSLEELMDESMQGESFYQNKVLDAFWTITQTKDEKKAQVARVYVAKARNGKSRYDFKIEFDYEQQTLDMWEISEDRYHMRMGKVLSKGAEKASSKLEKDDGIVKSADEQLERLQSESDTSRKGSWTPDKSEQ